MAFERKFLEDSEIKTYTMPDGTKYSPGTIVIGNGTNGILPRIDALNITE